MAGGTGYINGNPDQDHTLVVVFLRGGADGLNIVAPVGDDEYYRLRPQIALQKKETIALDNMFSLNQRLAPLAEAYRAGTLAIVHRAGSEDGTRSHFEAQDLMEHGGFAAGGWLGRYLRYRPGPGCGPLGAVAIGQSVPEVLRGAPATVVLENFDAFSFGETAPSYLAALGTMYQDAPSFLGNAGRETLAAMTKIEELRAADYHPANGAEYTSDPFGTGLRHIAQLIKARVGLEAATIDLDGWDSHFTAATIMDPLMDQLARGLAAFSADLGTEMARTTVVVMSEFGRRAYENASLGTDHGRGGAMFLLGGGVKGGHVYGGWPGLNDDHLEGPGDIPVSSNYRDVLAPILAKRSGTECLGQVFPDFDLAPVDLYA